jgi:3-methyl-2-oxobutanoate hydroxymethyltransferase
MVPDLDREARSEEMSVLPEREPLSIPRIVAAKGQERIAMMTAYDAPTAALLDAAGIDVLLVGDSVEMTVYGEPNTLSATMDSMIRHTRAVARAARRAVVVGDMPFLSYQAEPARAVENAGRFLAEGGAAAVKLEGGVRILPAVEAILAADIPVMGHVGLTPQSYRKFGGFKVQGREVDSARQIAEDARTLAGAGCFAIVLECVPEALAAEITREIPVPTIGIGAGPHCDGQVLVFHDVVGLTRDLRPKFVRRYAEIGTAIEEAARAFAKDVKSGAFPSREESFTGPAPAPLRRVH